MDYQQALKELQALRSENGSEHGLDRLAFRIQRRRTHALALELWASPEAGARDLAVRLADPEELGREGLDAWLREIEGETLADAFAEHLALHSSAAQQLMIRWAADEQQLVQRCGFLMVARLAKDDPDLDDRLLEQKLLSIESHLEVSTHKAKEAMSKALLTIGQRNDRLNDLAMEVAKKLGPIEIEVESGRLVADPVKILQDPELAKKLFE